MAQIWDRERLQDSPKGAEHNLHSLLENDHESVVESFRNHALSSSEEFASDKSFESSPSLMALLGSSSPKDEKARDTHEDTEGQPVLLEKHDLGSPQVPPKDEKEKCSPESQKEAFITSGSSHSQPSSGTLPPTVITSPTRRVVREAKSHNRRSTPPSFMFSFSSPRASFAGEKKQDTVKDTGILQKPQLLQSNVQSSSVSSNLVLPSSNLNSSPLRKARTTPSNGGLQRSQSYNNTSSNTPSSFASSLAPIQVPRINLASLAPYVPDVKLPSYVGKSSKPSSWEEENKLLRQQVRILQDTVLQKAAHREAERSIQESNGWQQFSFSRSFPKGNSTPPVQKDTAPVNESADETEKKRDDSAPFDEQSRPKQFAPRHFETTEASEGLELNEDGSEIQIDHATAPLEQRAIHLSMELAESRSTVDSLKGKLLRARQEIERLETQLLETINATIHMDRLSCPQCGNCDAQQRNDKSPVSRSSSFKSWLGGISSLVQEERSNDGLDQNNSSHSEPKSGDCSGSNVPSNVEVEARNEEGPTGQNNDVLETETIQTETQVNEDQVVFVSGKRDDSPFQENGNLRIVSEATTSSTRESSGSSLLSREEVEAWKDGDQTSQNNDICVTEKIQTSETHVDEHVTSAVSDMKDESASLHESDNLHNVGEIAASTLFV